LRLYQENEKDNTVFALIDNGESVLTGKTTVLTMLKLLTTIERKI